MKKQLRLGESKYFRNAAMYQPDHAQTVRTLGLLLLLLALFLIGSAVRAHAADHAANYLDGFCTTAHIGYRF